MDLTQRMRTKRLLGAVLAAAFALLAVGCSPQTPTPPGYFTIKNAPTIN